MNFPAQARVVIFGGGIVGASMAYHLTKLGWSDVLLLEQGVLGGGTTWRRRIGRKRTKLNGHGHDAPTVKSQQMAVKDNLPPLEDDHAQVSSEPSSENAPA